MEDAKFVRETVTDEVMVALGKKVRSVGYFASNDDGDFYLVTGNNNTLLCVAHLLKDGQTVDLYY